MMLASNMIGRKFGALTVTSSAERLAGAMAWNCECDCGSNCVISGKSLRSGNTKSCGCFKNRPGGGRNLPDIIGKKFGRLTVTEFTGRVYYIKWARWHKRWRVQCDCGNSFVSSERRLLQSKNQSCDNCLAKLRGDAKRKHGHKGRVGPSPTYRVWLQMKRRCYSPKQDSYNRYGGRGISVCDRWRISFQDFLSDMGRRPSTRHSLDRINVNGNYEPQNCRWVGPKGQARNRTTNRTFTIAGREICVSEIAETYGIKRTLLASRIRRGWGIEAAILTPSRKHAA